MSGDGEGASGLRLPREAPGPLPEIPRMTWAQVQALRETISDALGLPSRPLRADAGRETSQTMLRAMSSGTGNASAQGYLIESERMLQEHIRTGGKEAAQELLNELLTQIYSSAGNHLERIKPRVRELLVLMNRAAIDGGADIDEVFDLCCRYEREIDRCSRMEDLDRLLGAVLQQFIGFVFEVGALKHQNVIFKATDYIKTHLAERITLDQIAAQVYLSRSYFCRILKEELGVTFTEYVNYLRIERGKALLQDPELSICEVSSQVGFDDQSYFTRVFKKQAGISPGKYRRQYLQRKPPELLFELFQPQGKACAEG